MGAGGHGQRGASVGTPLPWRGLREGDILPLTVCVPLGGRAGGWGRGLLSSPLFPSPWQRAGGHCPYLGGGCGRMGPPESTPWHPQPTLRTISPITTGTAELPSAPSTGRSRRAALRTTNAPARSAAPVVIIQTVRQRCWLAADVSLAVLLCKRAQLMPISRGRQPAPARLSALATPASAFSHDCHKHWRETPRPSPGTGFVPRSF